MKIQLTILALCLAVQSSICDDFREEPNCLTKCCETLSYRPVQTYTFYQKTGRFVGGSGEWFIDTHTYSGQREGYLNPDYQCVANDGPLPRNKYKIGYCKNVMHSTTTRPCSFYLEPQDESKMCGRRDFFIHGCQCCTAGDHTIPPAAGCSAGCIVMNFENRLKLRVNDIIFVKADESEDGNIENIEDDDQQEFLTELDLIFFRIYQFINQYFKLTYHKEFNLISLLNNSKLMHH